MYFLAFAESIQLFPDGTIFIHIALILLMIWVLNRTFFRPINRVIASRAKFKGGRNVEADEILGQVEEKRKRYDLELREARERGYELIEKERAEAVAARQSSIAEARARTAEALAAEKQQLQAQTEEARAALAAEAEVLSDRISSSILRG